MKRLDKNQSPTGQVKRPDNKRPMIYVLFKKFGIRGAWRILHKDLAFDLKHGVNTAAPVSQRRLFGAQHTSDEHRYVPSTFDVMSATLDFAANHYDLSACGFVDLGSGKGKALIAACDYPFESVQGVELSAGMNSIAKRNVMKLGLGHKVDIFAGSAAQYSFKPHERIVYFFNSFSGDTLNAVLKNLADSPRSGPGLLIYVNPTERTHVESLFPCIDHRFIDPGQCEVTFHQLPALMNKSETRLNETFEH